MKIFSLFVLGLLCTTSVFAADGNVPASTLSSLGLGGMQRVSDVEGLKVRGQATATLSTNGTSLIFGQLVDPVTNSAVVVSSVNSTGGTVSGATPIAIFKIHGVIGFNTLNVPTSPYSGTIFGVVGGFGFVAAGP